MQPFELVIEPLDGGVVRETWIDEGLVTFGRAPDNQVVLDDRTISGRHGVLRARANVLVVEDCDSTNGVRVNGERVFRKTLFSGDVIKIGTHNIHVRVGSRNPRGFL